MTINNETDNKDKSLSKDQASKNHERLINMQQSEARLHWQRNNVFLIVSSIFLLTFSQINDLCIRITICICGIVVNLAWLLIQSSSSVLIHKWIKKAQEIEKNYNVAQIFSGETKPTIAIRKIAFIFPIIFSSLWVALIIILFV